MSDPTPPPDDELVSAVLDGVATADERARVDGDPRLVQRLAELGRVRDLVAEPVAPLDELTARRQLDHALAQLDGSIDAEATAATAQALRTTSNVGRAPAHRRNQLALRILSVAAVVLLALVAVPLLASLDGDDDADQSADSFDEASLESTTMADDDAAGSAAPSEEGSDAAADAGSEGMARAVAPETTAAPLGPMDSTRDAVAAARAAAEPAIGPMADGYMAEGAEDDEDTANHEPVCPGDPVDDRLVLETTAEVDGRQLLLRVWAADVDDGAAPEVTSEVIDLVTCEVLGRFPG